MAEKKKTIVFLNSAIVHDHNGDVEQSYEIGQKVTINEASADRWVRRGIAEEVKRNTKAAKSSASTETGSTSEQTD